MLFTASNKDASNSQRMTSAHVAILKDPTKVDDISTFTECGWFCVVAYKNRQRVLYLHTDSREQYERMMYPERAAERQARAALGADASGEDIADYARKASVYDLYGARLGYR